MAFNPIDMVIILDGFGFALFGAALYFGLSNYKKFKSSRVLWAVFNISMVFGALMALYNGLEGIGFYPVIMGEIEGNLTLVLVALLFTFAVIEKEENTIREL